MSSNNYFSCDYCGNLQSLTEPGVQSFAIHGYGSFTVCEFCPEKAKTLLLRTRGGIYYPQPEFIAHMEQQLKKQMNLLKRRYQMLQDMTPYVQQSNKKQKEESSDKRLFIRIRKQEQEEEDEQLYYQS